MLTEIDVNSTDFGQRKPQQCAINIGPIGNLIILPDSCDYAQHTSSLFDQNPKLSKSKISKQKVILTKQNNTINEP